jgi:uncharacterized ferritin-like protein (DUF455 family)
MCQLSHDLRDLLRRGTRLTPRSAQEHGPANQALELREVAERILLTDSIAAKLTRIGSDLTDESPGPARRIAAPGRPPELRFAPRRTAPAMPRPGAFSDQRKRGVAHHILANHELQALEVMAFVLLAFPDAPREFRRGLIQIMGDEQRHTRLHIERAAELGVPFGTLPVNDYIWAKAQQFESLLDYLAGLPLTFEGCNLDHTLEFEQYFERAGDSRSAAVLGAIHRDEIGHVRFGIEWLRRLKPADQTEWETYVSHLHWPLRAEKAIGDVFHREARLEAGLTPDFIAHLAAAHDAPDENDRPRPKTES